MKKLICVMMLFLPLMFAADITGTWQVSVETSQGTGTPTVEFQQKGEQITGTFHSQILGDVKLAGTLKGNAIQFTFEGDAGGQKLTATYKGTVDGNAMKGTAVYAGLDDGATWTATKK